MSKKGAKGKWRGKGRPPKPYENPIEVAVKARMRHTGLTEDQARHVRAGTVVGRLSMAGKLSDPLYEAAVMFHKLWTEAMAATLGPQGFERTGMGSASDVPTPDYIEWAIAAVSRYRLAKDRLSDEEWYAMEETVIEDRDPFNLEQLRSALTVCAKGYGLIRAKAVA